MRPWSCCASSIPDAAELAERSGIDFVSLAFGSDNDIVGVWDDQLVASLGGSKAQKTLEPVEHGD